jgi:hypothetical protein
MYIERQLLKSLNLEKSIKTNIKRWRDRFPPLIMERWLMRLMNVQFFGHQVLIPSSIGPKVIEICRETVVCLDTSVLRSHPALKA